MHTIGQELGRVAVSEVMKTDIRKTILQSAYNVREFVREAAGLFWLAVLSAAR